MWALGGSSPPQQHCHCLWPPEVPPRPPGSVQCTSASLYGLTPATPPCWRSCQWMIWNAAGALALRVPG
uniref:Uncharacterized protein n=1 Tax=Cebus imitator TaxID=2715852 RepID=A0A2K5R8J6_CEBIM